MTEISSLEERWRPLGLDSWHPKGYIEAMREIDRQLDMFDHIGKPQCKEMGAIALRSNLAHQATRNSRKHLTQELADKGACKVAKPLMSAGLLRLLKNVNPFSGQKDQKEPMIPRVTEADLEAARRGTIMPSDMVRLLKLHPELNSAELARLTHVGVWDTNNHIDIPVRQDLSDTEYLKSEPSNEKSYYTINALSSSYPNEVGIGRKRIVYSHFGGEVLTIITNNLLVDLSDKTLPRDFRISLRNYVKNKKDFRYTDHHNFLRDSLEPQLRNPNCDNKESGLIPLSTIYYATQASARVNAPTREERHPD